jgi:hypothetical protein
MDVPLKHVIGTIALIGLVIAVGLSYTVLASYIEAEVARTQLEQIAEHVSLNLVEIVSLVNFANETGNVQMKIISLPSDLGGKAYLVRLINETGKGCFVQAELVTRNDVVASSIIPINSYETQLKLVTDGENPGTLEVRGEVKLIYYSGTVYGGDHDIVVWASKESFHETWAGIGLWESPGG